jgi:hypothetical protein
MIKKWSEFIREEFINDSLSSEYINAKMQEFKDVIVDTLELADFSWLIDQGKLNITFSPNNWESQADSAFHYEIKYNFDLDELKLEKVINENSYDEEVEFFQDISSIEEGLDIIEKDIYDIIGVSESDRFKDSDLTGKRIELVRMEDPYTNLKPGDKGTCEGVDDMGHILMKWDNGSSLSIVPEVDEFNVVE